MGAAETCLAGARAGDGLSVCLMKKSCDADAGLGAAESESGRALRARPVVSLARAGVVVRSVVPASGFVESAWSWLGHAILEMSALEEQKALS